MYVIDQILRNQVEDVAFLSMTIDLEFAKMISQALTHNTSIKTMNFTSAFMDDASFKIVANAIIQRNIKLDVLILDLTLITKNSNPTIVSLIDKQLITNINMFWLEDYDENENLRNSLMSFANSKKVNLSYAVYPIPPKMPSVNEINAFFKPFQSEEKEVSSINDERKDFKPN